jgi:hypothetical protein
MRKEAVQKSRSVPERRLRSGTSSTQNTIPSTSRESESNETTLKLASPGEHIESPSSIASPPSTSSLNSKRRESATKVLQEIVEINTCDYFVDSSVLPPTHPILTKMLIGYEGLQRRRDVHFARSSEVGGHHTRTFVEKEVLDLLVYADTNRTELPFIAEMLCTFHGYRELPSQDKVILFKNFWIHFVVLERTYDSFRVLGTNPYDLRMVFSNGIIVNVDDTSRFDTSRVSDLTPEQAKIINPWFKQVASRILPLMKVLQPTEVEIVYCFGLLLFAIDDSVPVSLGTAQFARQMTEALHAELFAYYVNEFPGQNYVHRVAELMRYMNMIEKIVAARKEDILISKTFNVFKVDIFLDEIFSSE